eukprot:CAMPEP_0171857354 /NCGR_PEP_ID=MMETSP0992-20121227/24646_1 /TAXON_ID=483369 /ORGANISM="non described non described, Strain CCMP2098" /LENGTH=133 /DNA_ID=CAMNT_0012478587 /DNA_START=480 /DNA_END=881 /DNA_ORIENTATION=-
MVPKFDTHNTPHSQHSLHTHTLCDFLSTRGRFRVHDARGFDPSSMRRVAVKKEQERPCGVALLLGRRPDDHKVAPGAEQVITVMFDRSFRVPSDDDDDEGGSGRYELPFASQAGAEAWWHRNKSWLLESNPIV